MTLRRRQSAAIAATVLAATSLVGGVLVIAHQTPRHLAAGSRPAAAPSPHVDPTSVPVVASTPPTESSGPIRNVVLILADDLDWNLWRAIPRLAALRARGTTFTNYVVTDSLCCPSRTSLFRSQYVHNHQVLSNNVASGGGWPTFKAKGYQTNCLPTWLHDAGVHTGLVGKYLNQFPWTTAEQSAVEPGWDSFVVPVSTAQAYGGYDYKLDDNGVISSHGSAPADFLNDVLDAKASDFISHAGDHFFLELATYNPHLPSPFAPRHAGSHATDQAPRDPAFGTAVTNASSWLAGQPAFGPALTAHLDRAWRRRAQSAESVADSVDAVTAALAASGHADDTLILVTSDNGFHVGSYRMHHGKRTAFDVDTVVPLVAIGPGVAQGQVVSSMVSETDIGPTISAVLGAATPNWVDGRSLWALISDPSVAAGSAADSPVPWRTGVLSESPGIVQPGDPDYQPFWPPPYAALRTQGWLYVEYVNGERELYNRQADPYEIDNIVASAPASIIARLHAQLAALRSCAGNSCRVADSMPVP